MATAKQSVQAVSACELSSMIDKAVAAASKRLEVEVSPDNLIMRWDLVGRQLRDAGVAQKFAEDVAGELKKSGIAAEPATLIIKKQILAGYIDRSRISVPMRLL